MSNREKLAQMGIGDFLGRSYSTFDLRHKLSAFKVAIIGNENWSKWSMRLTPTG